ncbi:MAG: hypothetical protein D6791_17740, partial [Chloroflexi bacterium]
MSSVLEEDRLAQPIEIEAAKAPGVDKVVPALRGGLWPAVALVISIGLALRGQQLVTHREYPLDGPIFFAAAIALFLWGVTRQVGAGPLTQMSLPLPAEWLAVRSLVANTEYRLWFGVTAAMFSVLAYRGFAGNRFSNIGLVAWLLAVVCFLLAVAERPATDWRTRFLGWIRSDEWTLRITWVGLALIGITLVAIFFRTYRLAGVPAEMTSDHAEKLLDVN